MESVADEVLRLRFTGRNVESIYRNDDRIRELFIGRIGSIAGFSRSATKDVNGSVGFKGIAELAGARGGEQAVEYNLADPTAQALVLRETLALAEDFGDPANASPGQFVSVVGRSCLSRPPDQPIAFAFHAACHAADQPEFADLEQQRALQESTLRLMNPGDEQMWLLVISDTADRVLAAAILHRRWINQNAFMSYMHMPWELFGVVRDRVAHVPVLAAIHVVARVDLATF
jgi:hypothetical protein